MKNELTTQKQDVALTGGQKLQVQLLAELDKAASETGQNFTDYGKKCVINAIAGLVSFCKTNGKDIAKVDPTLLRLSLQNIGYTELNYCAVPSEIYFDIRNNTKANDGSLIATIKPQGAGNEKLLRKYGVGIKKDTGLHQAWLVREGDEFTLPSYNGLEVVPPTWKPHIENINKKVVMVVYPAELADGRVEYLIATRESIKPNIIAQIRQNTLYDRKLTEESREKLYTKLNEDAEVMNVDEFIDKYYQYVNPTYTSGGSKEAMILRKMKNNALKYYPKEFDNSAIKEAVEAMFEDTDDSLKQKPTFIKEVDVTEKVDKEISQEPTGDEVADFEVSDKPEPTTEEDKTITESEAERYEEMY